MADTVEVAQAKSDCRKQQLKLRKEISEGLTPDVFDTIAEKIISVIKDSDFENPIVSGFLPIGSEVDVRPAMAIALQNNFEICLPCVVENDTPLVFRKYREGDELVREEFGTKAPHPSADELLPNVIITPLLAFDNKGYRLGYGGGFYDRTIAKYHSMGHKFMTIGVALDMQMVGTVPVGEYDEPLNFVITEKNIYG